MKQLLTTPHIALLACSALILAGLTYSVLDLSNQPTPRPQMASAPQLDTLPTLACSFSQGEQRAYTMQNHVTVAHTGDRFSGTLSVQVIEGSQEGTVLRAAFTDLTLTQEMSQPADRVDHAAIEARPFIMTIDDTCAITKLGFARHWETPARQLVATILRAQEIVLPATSAPSWSHTQRDGGGVYDAHYSATLARQGVQITRIKQMYEEQADARHLGIALSVISSKANASFDPDTRAIASVHGEEHVQLSLPGAPPQVISQRFSTVRQDEAFLPIAALTTADVDFQDAFDLQSEGPQLHDEPVHAEMLAISHDQARTMFLAYFIERGDDGVLPAAKFLARWMRAEPTRAALLLADLRENRLPDHAHAALFLGFELAGDDASREALIEAIDTSDLSELNRARAASALSDHGTPTERGAEVLRAASKNTDSSMVATVSRLGLGTMANRAEGPLQEQLFGQLSSDLEQARSRKELVDALGAIGNAADDSFAGDLVAHLGDEEPSVRAHAAEALGRLSPELARHELVTQLRDEDDPHVIGSLLHGITQNDRNATQLSSADRALATQLLGLPHAGIRGQVIKWLGHFAQDQGARGVLIVHFHQERDVMLKQLIGQYISASELR